MEQPIRIAIVEDHELTRIGLAAALQRRDGLEVVGDAANGYQGLNLLKTTKPDLAIVDIGLPDIDGIELIRLVKTHVRHILNKLCVNDRTHAVVLALRAGLIE